MVRTGNVLASEIPTRFKKKKKSDKMGMGNEVVDGDGRQVAPRPRCVVQLQALTCITGGNEGATGLSVLSAPKPACWALGLRSEILLSQTPSLARRTGRSLGRKSL